MDRFRYGKAITFSLLMDIMLYKLEKKSTIINIFKLDCFLYFVYPFLAIETVGMAVSIAIYE